MPRKNRRNLDHLPPSHSGAAPDRFDAPAWAQVEGFEVREVGGQKAYRCPGCDHEVRPGARHLVVVPAGDAEARRHWHTECWRSELRRTGRYRPMRID